MSRHPNLRGITPVTCDGIRFASTLEWDTYRTLNQFARDYKMKLELQHPVLLKPKSSNYREIYWKVDFHLSSPSLCVVEDSGFRNYQHELLIEAKGIPEREFIRNVKFLDWVNPSSISRLVVVTTQTSQAEKLAKTLKGVTVTSLSKLRSVLISTLISDYSKLSTGNTND